MQSLLEVPGPSPDPLMPPRELPAETGGPSQDPLRPGQPSRDRVGQSPRAGGEPPPLGESWQAAVYVTLLAAALVVVGVWWGPLTDLATRAARL